MTTFDDIFAAAPKTLQLLVLELADIEQNPNFHPEGDVLTHTKIVTSRVIKAGGDMDLILTAFFHDVGKGATLGVNTKTGYPTAYGHERVSADLVRMHENFVKRMGGDVDKIEWLVKNHMRIKVLNDMRPFKRQRFEEKPHFSALVEFTKHDRGGTDI